MSEEESQEEFLEVFEEAPPALEAEEATLVLPLANDPDTPIPALREVKVQIVKLRDGKLAANDDSDDDSAVLLQDPEEMAPKPVALSVWAYALATFFDGKRTAREAVKAFEEKFKQPLPVEQALDLQRELDQALFLYSKRFEEEVNRQIKSYLDNTTRPAIHAGTSYPEESDILYRTLNSFFTAPDGPGELPASASGGLPKVSTVRSIVVPHIDLRVGGATYAHGYSEILKNCDAEIFVILGVAHQAPPQGMYYVSQKDFGTPLGVVKNAREISARLQAATGVDSSLAELTHRTEHSIEFQAVLLAGLLSHRKREFQIIPVLCGSVDQYLFDGMNPMESPAFIAFASALRTELDASGKKWCIICSVDLSHVGPEFNHSAMINERILPAIGRYDKNLLKIAASVDAQKFYNEILRTQNSRHVDAVLSILTMFKVCNGLLKSGRLLHYDQMLKEATHGAVSFASMAFDC